MPTNLAGVGRDHRLIAGEGHGRSLIAREGRSCDTSAVTPTTRGVAEALPSVSAHAPSTTTVRAPAQYLHEPDPLADTMCVGDGPPVMVVSFDPMLEELLAATFVVGDSVEDTPSGFADPHPVEATMQLNHPREDHPDIEAGDVGPPPGPMELDIGGCASFCRRMFRNVPEPLLPTPALPPVIVAPKQATRPGTRGRRTLVPTRSSLRLAARPSPVPVAQRVQLKLRRELDFINGKSSAPDAAITDFVDMSGQDLPEEAVKTIRAAAKLDNKELSLALAAIAAELGDVQMDAP